jgi:hypothetical protein
MLQVDYFSSFSSYLRCLHSCGDGSIFVVNYLLLIEFAELTEGENTCEVEAMSSALDLWENVVDWSRFWTMIDEIES